MKKQRRGKFTYIPKDEIAEVTTFNDVTFENDDLLDGAYVKGRKKYARGGIMKGMSLDQQAASAVGNDVWFSLPDIEKAELVEELVKSGMIVPTSSDTDVRIMELIGQNEFADGGMMADGGQLLNRRRIVLRISEMMRSYFEFIKNSDSDYGYDIESYDFRDLESGDFDIIEIRKGNDYLIIEEDKPDYIIFNGKKYYNKDLFKQGDKYFFVYYDKTYTFKPNGNVGALWGTEGKLHDIATSGLNADLFIYIFDNKTDWENIPEGYEFADGGITQMADGGETGRFKGSYRVEIGSRNPRILADDMTRDEAKDFMYNYSLKHPKADLELRYNMTNADSKLVSDNIDKAMEKHTTKLARGGFDVGRWYRDSSGEEFKYVGEDVKGNTLFSDGVKTLKKPIEDFGSSVKEEKLFSWFAKGGVATEGKFLVKYYLKESPNEFKEKFFDDRDKAEFFFETIQDDDDIVVMPIEEMRKSSVPAMSTSVYDKVIAEKAAEKSAPKSLFAAAKPVPVTKTAAKKRERVEVNGISDLISRYDELNARIKDAEAAKSVIGGELKEIGREKFLDLYEERGFRPANFDLADGNENILLEVTDKYLKVEPEKAAILENYDGLLEVKTTYEFNAEILEKRVSDSMTVGDVVSMLIQDSNLLSDSDKENLIKAKTTMRVPKGTIDRLLEYDNPREVFNLISPILALK